MEQTQEGAILGMLAELRIALNVVQARASDLAAENEQLKMQIAAQAVSES